MPRVSRTFRIFVSSTFSDLKEERNALQRKVFPKLRELCQEYGCKFQAIDLRWGVREEAALDQRTMQICLDEIARCQQLSPRPNFIVLLGDRYGWQPLPYEIPADEFKWIRENIRHRRRALQLLERWYWLDENAVQPIWCLQPRVVDYAAAETEKERQVAREKEATRWRSIERRLRRILCWAIQLPPHEKRRGTYVSGRLPRRLWELFGRNKSARSLSGGQWVRYVASATEQEIIAGAMEVEDAREHVFCFFRNIRGLPADRTAEGYRDLDLRGGPEPNLERRLAKLKKRLKKHVRRIVFEYEAEWRGNTVSQDHLAKLCDDVYRSLELVIRKEVCTLKAVKPSDQEVLTHQAFAEERARHFVGRAAPLATIAYYLRTSNAHPLVVWGEPGSGKSALVAKAIERAQTVHPKAQVVYRFVGVTPRSANGRELLEDLCREISDTYGKKGLEIPVEFQQLVTTFEKQLVLATARKPLFVFVDALDQFRPGDPARSLSWLPVELSEHVRLVVSTLPGDCLTVLTDRLPAESMVELDPMPSEEGEELLNLWLADTGRTLQENQSREVLGKFERCPRPLFLKVAFEQARRWRSWDEPRPLSPDIFGIIRGLFTGLSEDTNHGCVLVSRSLSYLAAAKNGLTEDELLDILSEDAEVMDDFRRRSPESPPVKQLPVVVWSRLFFDLEPYLTARAADGTSLITFYHPTSFHAVVAGEYLAGELKLERHRYLARYFSRQQLHAGRDGKQMPNLRKLSELPYQQAKGDLLEDLKHTLGDFEFLEAKVRAVGPQPLIDDYDEAFRAGHQDEGLKLVQDALRLSARTVDEDATQLAGQLLGRLGSFEVSATRDLVAQTLQWRRAPWLQPLTPSLTMPRSLLRFLLSGHTGGVGAVAVTPDGRFAVSGSQDKTVRVWDLERGELLHTLKGHLKEVIAVAVTPDGRRAASGCKNQTIKVWDLERGEELRSVEYMVGGVNSVAVTPDGRYAISASADAVLYVFDLERREELHRLKGHSGAVYTVAVTPDGRYAATGSKDRTVRLWDLQRGEPIHTLEGHSGAVYAVAVTPDGLYAVSGSEDRTVRLWDLQRGEALRTLEDVSDDVLAMTPDGRLAVCGPFARVWDLQRGEVLHMLEGRRNSFKGEQNLVTALSVTADGRYVVSGHYNNRLVLWDMEGSTEAHIQEGHSDSVSAVAMTPNGRYAVSGSVDDSLRVWDLQRREAVCTLSGHTREVNAVAVTRDGRYAVSGSEDQTLKVWDLVQGKPIHTLEGHSGAVYAVAVTRDGRYAVSGSKDKTLKVWDLEQGEELHTFTGHTNSVWARLCTLTRHTDSLRAFAMTADGRYAVSGSVDDTLRAWNLGRGEMLCTLTGHTDSVRAVMVTPDGLYAVSGSEDQTVRLWDLQRGEPIHTLEGHSGAVYAVAVTPDGRYAVSGSEDQTIRLWDLQRGEAVRTLEGHTGGVCAVAMTPDGRYGVSGSEDRTLRVWDLSRGIVVAAFTADNPLTTFAVVQDWLTIVAGDTSGVVHMLRLVAAQLSPGLGEPGARLLPRKPPAAWMSKRPEGLVRSSRRETSRASARYLSVPEMVDRAGLSRVALEGGQHAIAFRGRKVSQVVVQVQELLRDLVLFAVVFENLRRDPWTINVKGNEKRLLKDVSFKVNYVKALALSGNRLMLSAVLPRAALTPAIVKGMIESLASLADVRDRDFPHGWIWEERLKECCACQESCFAVDPHAASESILSLASQGGIPVRRSRTGCLVLQVELADLRREVTVSTSARAVSFVTNLPGVMLWESKLLALNGLQTVARVGLDPNGKVAFLYDVPRVLPDVLDQVREEFTVLLCRVLEVQELATSPQAPAS